MDTSYFENIDYFVEANNCEQSLLWQILENKMECDALPTCAHPRVHLGPGNLEKHYVPRTKGFPPWCPRVKREKQKSNH